VINFKEHERAALLRGLGVSLYKVGPIMIELARADACTSKIGFLPCLNRLW